MKKYTQKQLVGYLFWCIGLMLDDIERIVDTHPNNKPLETLTKEEFAVENADQTSAIVAGQLEDMGFDYKKLIEISNSHPMPNIEEFIKMCKLKN